MNKFFTLLLVLAFAAPSVFHSNVYAVNSIPLAYVIPVNESNWIKVHQMVNLLLKVGVPVYWVAQDFTYDGKSYVKGSFMIPVKSIPISLIKLSYVETNDFVNFIASKFGISLTPITKSIEIYVYVLKPIKIALYGGHGGLPTPYLELFSTLGFTVDFVDDNEIRAGALKSRGYDILVVPGDGSNAELITFGSEGGAMIQDFVKSGGGYISSCAGSWAAALGCVGWDPSYNLQLINAKIWNVIEGVGVFKKLYPGIGVMTFKIAKTDNPVVWGIPETFNMVWWQGPIFDVVSNVLPYASKAEGLVFEYAFTSSFTAAEYYSNITAQLEKGFNETTVYKALDQGKPVVVSGSYGSGRVVLFGPHPEFKTELVLNGFSYIPGRMPINAALWITSSGPYLYATMDSALSSQVSQNMIGRVNVEMNGLSTLINENLKYGLSDAVEKSKTVLSKLDVIRALYQSNPNPPWISKSLSWFGMTPNQMFEYYLSKIPELCNELENVAKMTNTTISKLQEYYTKIIGIEESLKAYQTKYDVNEELTLINDVKNRLAKAMYYIDEAISMKPGPTVTYGGKEGVLYLMNVAITKMNTAIANYGATTTTSATEPLRNIGTYGAAGCIVHALNSLRGRTAYADAEIIYAEYVISKLNRKVNELQSMKTQESNLLTNINSILDYVKSISASIPNIFNTIIAMGIVTILIISTTIMFIYKKMASKR